MEYGCRRFKFIGKFELPQPEPTPEEIAAEAQRIHKLVKQREYTKRYRDKRNQKMLQELAAQENQNQMQTGN